MSPVGERLRRRILMAGPISVAEYMAACLTDPDGYYATAEPFGERGDFVTAPEISQMFGEIVGAWLLDRWHRDGRPAPCDLVELGPGRGTLMADILRVVRSDAAFMEASRIVLVEASGRLRTRQGEVLGALHPRIGWADAPACDNPTYLVANEFFDALPIRQFVRRDGSWYERTVGLSGEGLAFGLSPFPSPLAHKGADGEVLELRPAGEAIARRIGEALAALGAGAALIIDYGYDAPVGGETLQAVKQHAHVPVLARPGEVDLSAHVDFSALKAAAKRAGAHAHGPVGQGAFLLSLGLLERAGQLGSGRSASVQGEIAAAVERLAGDGPGQMGKLFKVLALTPGSARPHGF